MRVLIFAAVCFFHLSALAQLRSTLSSYDEINYERSLAAYSAQISTSKSMRHRFTSPRLTQTAPISGDLGGTTYWTNSVTMQSYGKGKWGTYYYWDVQGNLREMRGFVDIAGKNKRGLKLVFPWR